MPLPSQAGRIRLIAASLLLATGCHATQIREFTRESYRAPEGSDEPVTRVYDARPEVVLAALLDRLREIGAVVDEVDEEAGTLQASIRWADAAERARSVRLGAINEVVTVTRRTYRSYSPLHIRCDSCVIRDGTLTSQHTEVVEDRTVPLDPGLHRISGRLHAGVEPVGGGTRVVLRLELSADSPDPPGLAPRSSGQLEVGVLDALSEALSR